jgi:hypothetical protein
MLRLACAATAVVASFIAAVSAQAQQKLDAPFILGRYYEQNGVNSCSNINACAIEFASPPAGRTLFLRRVACSFTTRPNGIGEVVLSTARVGSSGFARAMPLEALTQSVTVSAQGNFHSSVVSDDVFPYPVTGPMKIRGFLNVGGLSGNLVSLTCQVSGLLSPPPA